MSGKLVGIVLRGTPQLSPAAKLVMVVHAEYARERSNGVSWPSVATVASETGLSPRRVKAIRRMLVEQGYLTVVEPSRGGPKTTKYRINILMITANSVVGNTVKKSTTVSHATLSKASITKGNGAATDRNGVAANRERCRSEHGTVSPTTPEPEVKPLYKPEVEPEARGGEASVIATLISQLPLDKSSVKTGEPELRHMTREQQAAAVRARCSPEEIEAAAQQLHRDRRNGQGKLP